MCVFKFCPDILNFYVISGLNHVADPINLKKIEFLTVYWTLRFWTFVPMTMTCIGRDEVFLPGGNSPQVANTSIPETARMDNKADPACSSGPSVLPDDGDSPQVAMCTTMTMCTSMTTTMCTTMCTTTTTTPTMIVCTTTMPTPMCTMPMPMPMNQFNIGTGRTRSGKRLVHFGVFYNHDETKTLFWKLQYNGSGRVYRWIVRPKKNGGRRFDCRVVTYPGSDCIDTRWIMDVLLDPYVLRDIPLSRWKTTLPYLSESLARMQKHHADRV